ncbi:DNA polymerase phi-domain-containing protein [Aspergillus egyptiacus]|nr:DNA polymerase phi-domain-containing protein [Aspergillus egyptiacus]
MAQNHAGSKKRRREPVNVDTKLVEIYEDLASENDEIRLKAAQALVSQFTPDKKPTEEQVRRTLQRLFRGLCSSRKAARIGFSIALTEILSQVFSKEAVVGGDGEGLSVKAILGVWESVSNASASESGQEGRDHHFGRLFGAEAIIKSNILFSPKVLFSEWKQVLELVFELAKKKPWIREECGWIIYRCIHDLASQKADPKIVGTAIEHLCSNDLSRTPEGVAIWLAAKDRFPGLSLPSKTWKNDDPLDSKERNQLAKVMKESSSGESGGEGEGAAKPSGVWNSKLHFAWDALLTSLNSTPTKESKSKGSGSRLSFLDFWTEVVDNGLFAAASSEERKYWGFLLFNKVLNEHKLELASLVFTKNLVRCLMNQLAVEDRYLHRMAVKAAKSIQARVLKEPEFAAASVKGLMGSAGSVNFDQVTKTKTVEKIISEANLDAVNQMLPLFEKLVASPGTSESKAAASSRQVLAGLLLSMVRARATATDAAEEASEAALERILLIFARFAYFTSDDKDIQPPVIQQTQELFRSRINSCLNSIIAAQKHANTLPYAVVRKIRDAAKSEEFGKFIIGMDDTLKDSVKGAFKALKKLSSMDKKSDAAGVDAFRLLYSMTILQVYNGDADAASMLEELDFCYSKIFGDKKKKEEASEASDALVEILLSFASKQSQLFRRMSEQVFTAFAPNVTATGLESLISILEAKESLAGQQEMFDQQDDEEAEDADMMDVDEEDSDVEVVNAEDDEASEDEDEDEDGEASSPEDEDNGEDEAEIADFEAKLAQALGTHRPDPDAAEDEEGSESDEDMNDDEMEELDTQLIKVFQARRDALSKKKDKKDAKETMVNFKNRVLDLLEIYVKKCHSSILALDLLLPLLRLTRRSTVKQISNKANAVLREYTKLCKGSAVPALDDDSVEPVWALLRDIHAEAMRSGPPPHVSGCSQASLLVVKVLTAHDKENIRGVVDVYGETRKAQFLSRKCHVQPSFFTDWNNWCVSASKAMKN